MSLVNKAFVRLSSSYFFYFALLGLMTPFLSLFLDGKGFNSRQVGETLAILTATKIIAPSLWATLADKTGKPLMIMRLGAFLALLSFFLLYWFNYFWSVSLSLALFMLFWTAILPQLEVHTLTALHHRNKIYARVRLWGSIGFIVLAIVAGEAIETFGHESFITLGVVVLIGLFFSTLMLSTAKQSTIKRTEISRSILMKLLDMRFICFFIAGIFMQLSFAPYYGFFALYLRELQYSGFVIGLLISLGVVAEIVAFLVMGLLFKYFSLTTLLVSSLVITAVRWYLIPVVADSIFWLCVIQLGHAASFAIYHSASMAFISQHFSKSQQSRGQGIYLGGVYGIGGAIGAYITGILWLDGVGSTNAFVMAGSSALLGAIVMMCTALNQRPINQHSV